MRGASSRAIARVWRAGAALALVLLAGRVGVVAGGSCPQHESREPSDTLGHFLSAAISWTQIGEPGDNTVRFEIISTWRRKHFWPCNNVEQKGRAVGFSGQDGWPGIGDKLTVVGLSSVKSKQARQQTEGQVSTKLYTGDLPTSDQDSLIISFSSSVCFVYIRAGFSWVRCM